MCKEQASWLEGSRDREEGEMDEGTMEGVEYHQTASDSFHQVKMSANGIHQNHQLVELKH